MFHIHGYDSPINISIAQLRARDAKERKRHEKLLASQKASTANQNSNTISSDEETDDDDDADDDSNDSYDDDIDAAGRGDLPYQPRRESEDKNRGDTKEPLDSSHSSQQASALTSVDAPDPNQHDTRSKKRTKLAGEEKEDTEDDEGERTQVEPEEHPVGDPGVEGGDDSNDEPPKKKKKTKTATTTTPKKAGGKRGGKKRGGKR